jgi:hypothetical protein
MPCGQMNDRAEISAFWTIHSWHNSGNQGDQGIHDRAAVLKGEIIIDSDVIVLPQN